MAKDAIPDALPTSPISLRCPYCGAGPGKDCEASDGGTSLIHVQRIWAAAHQDMRASVAKSRHLP